MRYLVTVPALALALGSPAAPAAAQSRSTVPSWVVPSLSSVAPIAPGAVRSAEERGEASSERRREKARSWAGDPDPVALVLRQTDPDGHLDWVHLARAERRADDVALRAFDGSYLRVLYREEPVRQVWADSPQVGPWEHFTMHVVSIPTDRFATEKVIGLPPALSGDATSPAHSNTWVR